MFFNIVGSFLCQKQNVTILCILLPIYPGSAITSSRKIVIQVTDYGWFQKVVSRWVFSNAFNQDLFL
ncbi:hypothetical protein DQZ83_22660 [Salmonella enterica subsp. enterica serovar Oranienburg]|nr:hypothetical protein [Salmonella enterica]EBQ9991672.1 hypothetical protein [Salmonella enterica subsp. enterica serovar Oranienburg]EBZ1027890.1 hypothetical protein [Salmonella enterica subsp. enterica serovar Muenchen]ECI3889962.1 hypothetical protein [Salmonella enterica subsp. enterica serovar Gombe]MKU04161.1 hypothetical protein [Salmonella enterica subsp. enterica serovar Kinondoni]